MAEELHQLVDRARTLAGIPADFLADLEAAARKVDRQLRELQDTVQRLQEPAHLFPLISESEPLFTARVDNQQRFTYSSARFAQIFDLTPEQVVGATVEQIIPPGHAHLSLPYLGRIFQGETVSFCDEIESHGRPFIIQLHLVPYREPDGQIRSYFIIGVEITSVVQAERALHRSEQRYQALVEAADDGIVVCDPQGQHLFRNAAFHNALGYTPDDPMPDDGVHMLGSEEADGVRKQIQRVIEQGLTAVTKIEYRARHRQGHWLHHQAKVTLLRDGQGKPEAMLAVIRDVTEEKQTQEELRKARDQARASSWAKSEFLANMSHEIRTPIHGILGLVDLLQGTALDDAQRASLCELHDSTRALHDLINDTLDLSKIEAGKVDLEEAAFSPVLLAQDALKMVAPKCRDKGLDLRCDIDPSLPPLVLGDPVRVRQVLVNLLVNAAKFTPQGEIGLIVRQGGSGSGRLHFEVRDTGIGIADDQLERIFDSFHQVEDSRARSYGGAGLGLAIARQFTELMGGQLHVESRPGHGSRFFFGIPLRLPSAGAARRSSSRPSAGPLAGTVLVAEDNPLNLRVVKRYLTNMGLRVIEAHDGEEALRYYSKHTVQLVLMDIRMPTLDGIEATRRLRAQEPPGRRLPIIALTADAMKGDRERCLEAGMDDYLNKPFTREELERLLWRYLGPRAAS